MASRAEIRFHFQQALNQADKLESIADNLEGRAGNKLSSSISDLSGAWRGSNAKQFLRKEDALADDIRRSANQLRDIAGDIKRIAKIVYNAEMEALRIANERD